MTLTTTEQPPQIVLSEEQQLAITKIHEFLKSTSLTSLEFKLGGYAGTGKTTIIKHLLTDTNELSTIRAVVCAFTGKACSVLQRKGIHSAQTIHSLIYDVQEISLGVYEFTLKPKLDYSSCNLIIVDEASMISTELYNDLKSFHLPILFVGDPGQLEPVGDNPNLMKVTDYTLTKIHRQAEKSPIITLATQVRQGFPVRIVDPTLSVTTKGKFITDEELSNADQVICAKNATRSLLNRRVRTFLGHVNPLEENDKLICLRNNRKAAVFNGLIVRVKEIHNEYDIYYRITAVDEVGKLYPNLEIWKKPFTSILEPNETVPRGLLHFDYGYAITCHKSQGSEWPHVLVYDEVMFKTDMKKWRYTAITRASEKLTYCI